MHELIRELFTWRLSGFDREVAGYVASGLVLATFSMKSMRWLRAVGILSNFGFIFYALVVDLPPILILHSILLPVNVVRLVQLEWSRPKYRVTPAEQQVAWKNAA